MERDLDVLQQNSGMLNWRRENIKTAKKMGSLLGIFVYVWSKFT